MLSRFIDYIAIERQYSDKTVKAYSADLEQFAAFLGLSADELDMNLVTADDVREWMLSMLEAGISPRSVKRRLSSLHSYSKFCLRVGITKNDVTQKIISPKTSKQLPVFFKDDDMKRFQETEAWADDFISMRNNLVIEMLYQTGMRRSELLGLKDDDIDLPQQQIRVFGKRRKERIVPIGDSLCLQIQKYIDSRTEATGMEHTEYFLSRDNGKPMQQEELYNVVTERMGEVSTLKKRSPHVLRHTFATTMLNNGADINTIKELLGHASLAATQIYTHATFEQINRVYRHSHPRNK